MTGNRKKISIPSKMANGITWDIMNENRRSGLNREEEFLIDPFERDYISIRESKAFRRLQSKTQTISHPYNLHASTRLSHTIEIENLVGVITDQLGYEGFGLNKYLGLTIAAGHDIGHTPYGHVGEKVLSEILGEKFSHANFSAIVAQEIERKGRGLNLRSEVLEGIINHSMDIKEFTPTGKMGEQVLVKLCDKICYTCADLNDAIRYEYVREVPTSAFILGANQRERIGNLAGALIKETLAKGKVSFSEGPEFENFIELRKFLTENFYFKKNDEDKILNENLKYMNGWFKKQNYEFPEVMVALLTDEGTNYLVGRAFHSALTKRDVDMVGLNEIVPYLTKFSITKPDVSWIKREKQEI